MSIARALARLARAQRDVADALEALAAAHAEPQSDPSEWVPHTAWPVASPRVACRLARSGAIEAKRSGKRWIATRAELDRYLAACPAAQVTHVEEHKPTAADELESVRRRFST